MDGYHPFKHLDDHFDPMGMAQCNAIVAVISAGGLADMGYLPESVGLRSEPFPYDIRIGSLNHNHAILDLHLTHFLDILSLL